jgi:hypothetical protein
MMMVVTYKKRLKVLYPFEEGTIQYWVKYPSKIVFDNNVVREVDDIHFHNWIICDINQLVEIKIVNS